MTKNFYNYETENLPDSIQSTQEWFGSIISNPLNEKENIAPISPNGILIAEEAGRYIIPNSSLAPYQRMQIYNQQYWWRLLKTLHTNFPLLTRLFGYRAFNEEIGVPFFNHNPPSHWSIPLLGERLPQWIAVSYTKPDLPLIQNAAALDWQFTESYIAPQKPPLDLKPLIQNDPEALLNHTFYLQPHVQLFSWEYDLFAFREAFLKEEVEYWFEHPFPQLPKGNFRFVFYRTINNLMAWKEVQQGVYLFLSLFKEGCTVASACEMMEKEEEAVCEETASNMQKWIENWVRLGLLTLQK
jgi:hypothetical protein